jgi:phage terminase large subunit
VLTAEGKLKADIPAWSVGIFKPARYKVAYGGRGSSKSWTFARALLMRAASKPTRVLCTREVQLSIRDSVHRLLSDQIESLGIGGAFEVTRDEIRHSNGSMFVFSGLAQHTVESIKSFEGIDVVWCEEAQNISKRSWDVLLPTIRKAGSEVWLTLNPHLETDETYQRFVANPPPNSWLARVNWRDNPWFSDVLDNERKETERRDPDNYANIWEGEPLRVAEGAIYRAEVESLFAAGRVRTVPVDPIIPVHTVWDLGWADSMAIAMVQRSASEIRVVGYLESSNQVLSWYIGEIEKLGHRWGTDYIPHDGASRDFKTGKSTEELLKAMGRKVRVLEAMSVEEGIRAARAIFPRAYFDQVSTVRLVECLKRYKRIVNRKTGEPMGPLHDEFSHGADCWRYVAQAVDMMRNESGRRSVKIPDPSPHWAT